MTIKQKQWQLKLLGYYTGEIDGDWGNKSKTATENFQKAYGLNVDGDFGTKTEAKSIEIIKTIQKAVGVSTDGLAGLKTQDAVKTYQKKNRLTADGIAGAKTLAKIKSTTTASEADFWKTIKYFKKDEFKCTCKGKYCNGFPADIDHDVVNILERARKHFGKAGRVSSGVRCAVRNSQVGGVSNSRHKLGKAADFSIAGVSAATLYSWVSKQPETRYTYKIDGAYVHVDVN